MEILETVCSAKGHKKLNERFRKLLKNANLYKPYLQSRPLLLHSFCLRAARPVPVGIQVNLEIIIS